jgi:hypothetical protein
MFGVSGVAFMLNGWARCCHDVQLLQVSTE